MTISTTSIHRTLAVAAAALIAGLTTPAPARADTDTQILVDKATATLRSMLNNPDQQGLRNMINQASAVLIAPTVLKAAFIFGAEGGSGVLVARDNAGGWGYPSFYTVGSASFGLQFGAQASDVIFVIRTPGALDAILRNQVKLGADVSAALGPIGVGREAAATTNVGADIVAFAQNEGLFAGGSIEGTVIAPRSDRNREYYNAEAPAREIVAGRFVNPGADALRAVLMGATTTAGPLPRAVPAPAPSTAPPGEPVPLVRPDVDAEPLADP